MSRAATRLCLLIIIEVVASEKKIGGYGGGGAQDVVSRESGYFEWEKQRCDARVIRTYFFIICSMAGFNFAAWLDECIPFPIITSSPK